jgi:hypothetical protein
MPTCGYLMYVKTESLINCLGVATSITAKTGPKTLKEWEEDSFDINGMVNIPNFTAEICPENQQDIAQSTKPGTTQAEKREVGDNI